MLIELNDESNAPMPWQWFIREIVDQHIPPEQTGIFSPETPQPLHEDVVDRHDQIVIPSPASLFELARRGEREGGGPEGQINTKLEKIAKEVVPSKLKRSRRGGFCRLGCGTHLSRVDSYRLHCHYISCPHYTGDRQALKARYRKRKKSKQAKEKSDGAQAEAITVTLGQPLRPQRISLDRQAPCSGPVNHPGIQVTIGSEPQHTFLAQPHWDLFGIAQVPTSANAVADTSELNAQEFTNEDQRTTGFYPAMGFISSPTSNFHNPVCRSDNGNIMYATNMSMLPYCSDPHPDMQAAMHPIPTQLHRVPFDAAQVPTAGYASTMFIPQYPEL